MSGFKYFIAGLAAYGAAVFAANEAGAAPLALGLALILAPFLLVIALMGLFSEDPAFLYPDELSSSPDEANRFPSRRRIELNGSWMLRPPGQRRWIAFAVPGAFPLKEPGSNFLGRYRFARDFEVPSDWEGRGAILTLPPMSGRVRIYLNGAKLEALEEPELGWRGDVEEFLSFGDRNRIEAVCDYSGLRPFRREMETGERTFGGLFGEAWLEEAPRSRIASLSANGLSFEVGGGRARARTRFEGDFPNGAVLELTLYDPMGAPSETRRIEVGPGEWANGAAAQWDLPSAGAWTPDRPERWLVEARLTAGGEEDRAEAALGMRPISHPAEGGALERVGLAWCGWAPKYHRAMPAWLQKRDVRLVREVGMKTVYFKESWIDPKAADACAAEGVRFFVRAHDRLFGPNAVSPDSPAGRRIQAWIEEIGSNPAFLGWLVAGNAEAASQGPWAGRLKEHGDFWIDDARSTMEVDLSGAGAKPPEGGAISAFEESGSRERRVVTVRPCDGSFRKCPPDVRERRNGHLVSMTFAHLKTSGLSAVCLGSLVSRHIYPGFYSSRRKEKAALKVAQSFMSGRSETVVDWPPWRPPILFASLAAVFAVLTVAAIEFEPAANGIFLFFPQYLPVFLSLPFVLLLKALSGAALCCCLHHYTEANLLRVARWQSRFEGPVNSVFLDWEINDRTRFAVRLFAYFYLWAFSSLAVSHAFDLSFGDALLKTGLTAPFELFALALLLPGMRWRPVLAAILFMQYASLSHVFGLRGAAVWAGAVAVSALWLFLCAVLFSQAVFFRRRMAL